MCVYQAAYAELRAAYELSVEKCELLETVTQERDELQQQCVRLQQQSHENTQVTCYEVHSNRL